MSITQIVLIAVALVSVAMFFFPAARKGDIAPEKKETWKSFGIGMLAATLITLACYRVIIVPIILWLLLFAGGLVPWWSKFKKAFAYQWGAFFGITVGLAILFGYFNDGI